MEIETIAVQSGYKAQNGEPIVLPLFQSTTYKYDSAEHLSKLFDLTAPGHMYTRISNPTSSFVEEKIAALCGGVGALLTSSGQAASLIAIMNLAKSGDHIVVSNSIYGGTINLFNITLKKFGIETTFVNQDSSSEEIGKAFKENTKALFGETLSNPTLNLLDIEKFAKIAHEHGVPLLIDNTFPTPILCRPIEHGADVVIHSTTKYMDGHATIVGGAIVDAGKFNYANGKFPEFTEPDVSYHGLIYTKDFADAPYITKARVQLMRDLGSAISPFNAFLLNNNLQSLHLRMERHSQNAFAVAQYLEAHPKVSSVNYPKLASNGKLELVDKYLKNGCSGVLSFEIVGGRAAAVKFMDALKMASIVVHVADCRTCVLHPASTTHRQLTDEQLENAGISASLVRFSVGTENIKDIIADIEQALRA